MGENKAEKIGNLKSKLDGNRLDLSLCELSSVPVKEIVDLKKVTDLDLSRNRLSTLTPEFCTLASLTTLDLSSNYLRALPDRFGSLHALQRLDLYKNQLTDLPLSFCKLKQLKWLDLKDNCLNEQLRIVAGDFSSEKDCRQAATKVVQYMQKRQSDHERERQKRLTTEREADAAKKAKEEAERKQVQMEKKKQKENKKKNVNANVQQNANKRHADEANGTKSFQSDNSKHRSGRSEHRKQIKTGWSRKICKFVWKLLLCLICIPILLSAFVIVNCSMEREILPKSRPLCHDVYNFMTTGRIHVTWDYGESYRHVILAVKRLSDHVIHEVKHFEYEAWRKWSGDHVTDFRAKIQPAMTSLIENGQLFADWSIKNVRYWSINLWKSALIIADCTYILGTEVAQWSVDTGRDVMQNYPTYWEKVKFYWQNLK